MTTDIKNKIADAIGDMESKIGRDSKHIYIHNESGNFLQGVSTVSSIVPKDWLAAWGSKEAVKALGYDDYGDVTLANQVLKKIKSFGDVSEYMALLKEAKGASARKSKKAMIDGTAGHKWLESFVEARIKGSGAPAVPVGTPLERPIMQFLEWEAKEVDYWIASEALICNIEKGYAGQLDAIYMSKAGRLCLADFKFASHVSEDYYLQTAGYAAAFESYGIQFDDRIIIRLPKTLETDEWNAKEYKYRKVPNNIEVHTVPTLYEVDRNAFFSALPLKQWINMIMKLTNKS